ncbi:Oidioi.mRNA.OKI2018_I69.chr2.g8080.t1.cds [Oikopleura dioica]|uniref:Oidioi.mRNA.OKI2018_I69.chr2.g8080.t1.cds n=1 Tax=Oikopleura dioica TaxID=34765 RepID=A0ABN7TCU2_OIKDI|nr:Oidioi.mRNA.OKI2018_I69.chr2.g8080.t1.cds [Oikopleura dioica]
MLQFGPTEEIAALSPDFKKTRLPEEEAYLPITSDELFNKSEEDIDILVDEETINCQTTSKSTIQSFFLDEFKSWNPETFLKLITQRVAEKSLRVVFEDIDENIIIPVFQILHRTHSTELNVIGILAEMSDNVWTLSRNTRIFLLEASKYYMLKPERVILERVVYYLRKANTPKNQEVVLLLEQLGRSSCSLDSAVLDAYCDLTVDCTESYDLVFDTSEEGSHSSSNPLSASLPLEIPELEEPLWKNMSKLSFSKADFKSFIALRHSS